MNIYKRKIVTYLEYNFEDYELAYGEDWICAEMRYPPHMESSEVNHATYNLIDGVWHFETPSGYPKTVSCFDPKPLADIFNRHGAPQ